MRTGKSVSHEHKGWEKLTVAAISWFNKNLSGLVSYYNNIEINYLLLTKSEQDTLAIWEGGRVIYV